jgi:1,4-alpha-glucan branching enzyme
MGGVTADGPGWHGQPHSADITIPPLSAVFLIHEGGQ